MKDYAGVRKQYSVGGVSEIRKRTYDIVFLDCVMFVLFVSL